MQLINVSFISQHVSAEDGHPQVYDAKTVTPQLFTCVAVFLVESEIVYKII
jgi:hypothetical protein